MDRRQLLLNGGTAGLLTLSLNFDRACKWALKPQIDDAWLERLNACLNRNCMVFDTAADKMMTIREVVLLKTVTRQSAKYNKQFSDMIDYGDDWERISRMTDLYLGKKQYNQLREQVLLGKYVNVSKEDHESFKTMGITVHRVDVVGEYMKYLEVNELEVYDGIKTMFGNSKDSIVLAGCRHVPKGHPKKYLMGLV